MKNFLAVHRLISSVNEHCATNQVSHDEFTAAMMMLLLSDMRAFNLDEHNLTDDDGVLLLNVRRME